MNIKNPNGGRSSLCNTISGTKIKVIDTKLQRKFERTPYSVYLLPENPGIWVGL